MLQTTQEELTLSIPSPSDKKKVLKFHEDTLDEFLWPRDLSDFEKLIENQSIFQLTNKHQEIVGLSYILHAFEVDEKTERLEFGGVFVLEKFRGLGLASALGTFSIAQQFVLDPPQGRLIAHVHEDNDKPIHLLQNQLGFTKNGQEIPPVEPPPNMKQNSNGEVVGHLYVFQQQNLIVFSEFLRSFNGTIEGKENKSVQLNVKLWIAENKDSAIKSLVELTK